MKIRTEEDAMEALDNGASLQSIPRSLRTKEVCLNAVQTDGMDLQFVPDDLRTEEMCLEAVFTDGSALQFVPDVVVDRKLCLRAVDADPFALEFVPARFMDPDVCRAAVEVDGMALMHVPEAFRTPALCREALYMDPNALDSVPKQVQREIVEDAVQSFRDAGSDVPGEVVGLLEEVPSALRTPEVCMEALLNDPTGRAMELVPEDVADEAFCARAAAEGFSRWSDPEDFGAKEWLDHFWESVPSASKEGAARILREQGLDSLVPEDGGPRP